ncbi:hypothetical protein HII28_19730 [Planctomonas sp. JC2975]|uniref:hypothetical protein n=1 Tax=Planctomonas sp. JC2975 TaxID=2729626 RepID=UPI001475B0A3|nr:hypothetical protein [Planctomonas sp. JC2975]NNC14092.1 hypothetical protein [Planctomonas sp. JC2975]
MRLETVRAAFGAVELVMPSLVGQLLLWRKPDVKEIVVARVLGARHLIQAVFTSRAGSGIHVLGADVDLLHGVSMLLLATLDPKHRRAALTTTAIAFLFAVCEYHFHTHD